MNQARNLVANGQGANSTRTINGKSLKQVFDELSKPFDKKYAKQNNDKYDYIPAGIIRKRFNHVLGPACYDDGFIENEAALPHIVSVESSRHSVVAAGYIRIKDDNGNEVCYRSGSAGVNVIIVSATEKPKNLTHHFKSIENTVFAKIAKTAFECGYIVKSNPGNKGYTPNNNSSGTNEASGGNQQNTSDTTQKIASFKIYKKAKSVGSKAVSMQVSNSDGIEGELIVWKSKLNHFKNGEVQRLMQLPAGETVKAVVEEKMFAGKPQYHVNKLVF